MKTAIVAGSFDPVTLGHVELFRRAAGLFDRIIVGAVVNAEKHYCFTVEQRLEFLKDAVKDIPNVTVEYSDEMLYAYVLRKGACAVVKGVRDGKDTDYEIWMSDYNRQHAPSCDTVLLPADKALTQVSSTEVKRLAQAGKDITAQVTPMVAAALRKL